MDFNQLLNLLNSGKVVTVKATKDIYKTLEESMDPGMISKVLSVEFIENGIVKIQFDFNGFESHNKSVARSDWYDKDGNQTKTWFTSGYYPKDGIEIGYFLKGQDLPFELVEQNKPMSDYLASNMEKSYLEFLEEAYENNSK